MYYVFLLCSALEDANRAIALDVSWAKGYYRQGRAFAGLKVNMHKLLSIKFLIYILYIHRD